MQSKKIFFALPNIYVSQIYYIEYVMNNVIIYRSCFQSNKTQNKGFKVG